MPVISLCLLLWLSVAVEGTCIDRLPSSRQEIESLLLNPPSNVSLVDLRFNEAGEQRTFYGTKFTCDGCITKVTFAADSTSAGEVLPELGVWQETGARPFNLLAKTAGVLLHPGVVGELSLMVEGSSRTVHIHEVIPDSPLPFSPGQFPGLFSPDSKDYKLVPYLFNVTDFPTDDRTMLLSYFQMRSQVTDDGRIVVANGGNLLPVMALEISTDINGTCAQPNRTNLPLPSTSSPPSPTHTTSPPPTTTGLSTAIIILAAVLPAALILLVCATVLVTTVICLTCRPGEPDKHHTIPAEMSYDDVIPTSELQYVYDRKGSSVINDHYSMTDEGAAYEEPVLTQLGSEDKHTYASIANYDTGPPLPPNHPIPGSPAPPFGGRLSPMPNPSSQLIMNGRFTPTAPPPIYHTLEHSARNSPVPTILRSSDNSPATSRASPNPPSYYHTLEPSPQGSPVAKSGRSTPITGSRIGSMERLLFNGAQRFASTDHLDPRQRSGSRDQLTPDPRLRFTSVDSPGDRAESPDYHILECDNHFSMVEGIFVPTQEQRSHFTLSEEPLFDDITYATFRNDPKSPLPISKEQFFPDEDMYWKPASNSSSLFEQLSKKKYREILRRHIKDTGLLGSGEFGMVCRGEWLSHKGNKSVALKMLNNQATEKDKVHFLQEAAIVGQFKHPNIVRLIGVVTIGKPVMMVFELMTTVDLWKHLQSLQPVPGDMAPFDLQQKLLEYCKHVALGMEYLSRKGFVHKDLAAHSILMSDNGECKIANFGMSRDLEDEDYCASHDKMMPVRWAAPEALNLRKYTSASDVWSFGVLMYEIWSVGQTPYRQSDREVVQLVASGYRLPPPPGCPKAIYHLMINSWHPEASERPSFANLAEAIAGADANLLRWSPKDVQLHPQAATLGAPLEAGQDLFLDLQHSYTPHTEHSHTPHTEGALK